jgi:hypothetical protein
MVRRMSFFIDPVLLVGAGAAIERYAPNDRVARIASVGAVVGVAGLAVAFYSNAPGLEPIWGPFGSSDGREFQMTTGLANIDEQQSTLRHVGALSMMLLYPLWLMLGRWAVRSRRDKQ